MQPLPSIQAVLWDLDGTLLDTVDDICYALNQSCGEIGLPAVDRSKVRSWIGQGVKVLMERALRFHQVSLDANAHAERVASFERHYWLWETGGHSQAKLYPTVRATLTRLSALVPMAVVTNKPEAIAVECLRGTGLSRFFATIIGGDTLPERKPHPAPLIAACQRLGVSVEKSLMVGDSETDWHAARAVPMPVVLVNYGYSGSVDLHALSQSQLLSAVDELFARFSFQSG
jgi:phosphoglycolate phosphatase